MFMCCAKQTSVMNLIYSGQELFSNTRVFDHDNLVQAYIMILKQGPIVVH